MYSEEIIFKIIVHSGNAKSLCFDALHEAKNGNYEKAKELMKAAKAEFIEAHHVQTDMLQKEAAGEKTEMNLLMVHAQDHLMGAGLAKDLIEEMITLYQKVDK